MKKIVAVLLGALVAVSVAIAQTNVYSRNAVGFVKVDVNKGEWAMVKMPFNGMAADDLNITNVFDSVFPDGTLVYFWDTTNQVWRKEVFAYDLFQSKYRWQPGTKTFTPGEGVFISVPATAPSNTYTAYLLGEVPSASTTTVQQVEGFTLFGYPYPVSATLTGTVFGAHAQDGDILYYWKTNQTWGKEVYAYDLFQSKYRWQPGTLVLEPGMAFFYETGASQTNKEVKPYSYP